MKPFLLALLILLLIPISGHGQGYMVPFSPQASGTPATVYFNGFELTATSTTDCAGDDGVPADTSTVGDANCNFADSSIEGSEVVEIGSATENVDMLAGWSALEEGWARVRFQVVSGAPANNTQMIRFNTDVIGDFDIRIDGDSSAEIVVGNVISTPNTSIMADATWYILDIHWSAFDGVSLAPTADMTVYLESTLAEVSTQTGVALETDEAMPGVTGVRFGNKTGSASIHRWDCLEVYSTAPGAVTASCNAQ